MILLISALALVAAFFFGFVASALADETSVGSIGGIVYPLTSTDPDREVIDAMDPR